MKDALASFASRRRARRNEAPSNLDWVRSEREKSAASHVDVLKSLLTSTMLRACAARRFALSSFTLIMVASSMTTPASTLRERSVISSELSAPKAAPVKSASRRSVRLIFTPSISAFLKLDAAILLSSMAAFCKSAPSKRAPCSIRPPSSICVGTPLVPAPAPVPVPVPAGGGRATLERGVAVLTVAVTDCQSEPRRSAAAKLAPPTLVPKNSALPRCAPPK
mmetsp:Transcript_28377/g.66426  ORF Transcript_28377/g.66426 Transcript_28377/m.66426 type:complete len:222 (-) Transcript_28377:375-1040(-)